MNEPEIKQTKELKKNIDIPKGNVNMINVLPEPYVGHICSRKWAQ